MTKAEIAKEGGGGQKKKEKKRTSVFYRLTGFGDIDRRVIDYWYAGGYKIRRWVDNVTDEHIKASSTSQLIVWPHSFSTDSR